MNGIYLWKLCNAITIIFFLFIGILYCQPSHAETIRQPAWAGQFYPKDPEKLKKMIQTLTQQVSKSNLPTLPNLALKALIMPHAGYVYSGLTAAHVSYVLKKQTMNKIIIMAPDHRVGFANAAISLADSYETPLGIIPIHKDAERLRQSSQLFHANSASDKLEHSVEVILPFLQLYINCAFQIIPVVIGSCDPEQIASHLKPIMDDRSLLIASSDLSHYLPYADAIKKDNETIEMILNLNSPALLKKDNAACGKNPILVIMHLARQYDWKPILLHQCNSGDTAGDKNRVVGYATIAFYGGKGMTDNNNQHLPEHLGQALVQLAKQTIAEELGQTVAKPPEDMLANEALKAHNGVFVTLHKHGQLRGCIGSLEGHESIVNGIKRNAINAAFHDPRFPRVKPDEFDKLDIEVSVLTQPQPLQYKDAADLIAKIRPKIDGLIIQKGYRSATFLPQVWDQLPTTELFLSHLCQKAGLASDTWKSGSLEVKTYQVQYFEDNK